ncbi:histidinol-phosphate transaminase [Halobacillus shinanisalinarum]|uniref:Histidinol-phosphate aminotransferase n=1 Tax=Halobacillus shinanisalinarum TaxID=2932258 RepID=A0ABY4GZ58_9BACI|nr:histidinol-phosphate transaminase [Halobacillus shinanisalinarum]UOQ92062.1 histidinol-phosphate transaminase [Halobacillus shinanisalinarum]
MIQPRSQINQIAMYSPGKPVEELKREKGLSKIIKMASNENPFGYSPLAAEAIQSEMKELPFYPEVTSPILAEKLANRLEVSPDQIIFGSGSDEVIRLLSRTYINEGDEVVMAGVTFPRYKTNVVIEGGVPVEIDMQNGTHDLDAMYQAINEKTKMVFVCNPNNPTGTIVEKEALRRFIEKVPSHVMLVMDEAYYEYADSSQYLETLPLLNQYENMVILRTFSKVYGLAALRIGYGLMSSEMVSHLRKVKEPFNVNRLAEAAASASLDDDEFMHESINLNREGREYLNNSFDHMNLGYFPTQTNFIMVDVGAPAEEVYEYLLDEGIIIRPGHLMGYPTMIRVTIGKKEDNQRFIECLQAYLEKKNANVNQS